MIKFSQLGFKSFKTYKDNFFNNLLPSNKTFSYFLDFKKVKLNIDKYLSEIYILNTLIKIDYKKRLKYLKDLLKKYPDIVEVLPIIIAVRLEKDKKLIISDDNLLKFFYLSFDKNNLTDINIDNILLFFEKTSMIDIFDKISNLYDYLLGVEVGLDTNSRKNRSGKIFERFCNKKIIKILKISIK